MLLVWPSGNVISILDEAIMIMRRWLVASTVLLWTSLCFGQQFYECKVAGSAPIYQDFPCNKGQERTVNGGEISTVDAVKGLVKHGYLERAHQYALSHGMTEAQLQSLVDQTNRNTQRVYDETRREVAARQAEAAREQALKAAAAEAAYLRAVSQPIYVPESQPDSGLRTPDEVVPPRQPAWQPAAPVYDPQGNRWCQNTSPTTIHCWQ
jgi:hypothetical protein